MNIASCCHASHEMLTLLGLDVCVLSVESGVDAADVGLSALLALLPDESAACKICIRS